VQIIALVHETGPCTGVFAEVASERGDELEEWSVAWGTPPPKPLDEYDAVLAFGGVMQVHEERYHPWLREENMLIQRFLDQGVPFLGICLGGQLLAKAAHAPVTRAPQPEVGWFAVDLLPEAESDEIFGHLPPRLTALQWHYYRFDLPGGAIALAKSPACLQAFRLGDSAWGVQFHSEVTAEMLNAWIDAALGKDPAGDEALEEMRAGIDRHIEEWNGVGREMCTRFLGVAERERARRMRPRAGAGRGA
jgi:GMP synthase-like glutamine amidotransferase